MKNRIKLSLVSFFLLLCLLFSSCSLIVLGGSEEEVTIEDTGLHSDTASANDFAETSKETDNADTVKTNTENPETAADRAKKRLSAMTDYDFGGQSFIIATTSSMTFATSDASYYDKVLLLRDSLVEEKYNCDIVTVFTDESKIEETLRNASLSGESFADMISVPEYKIGRLASEGLLLNLRSLPFYSTKTAYSDSSEAVAGNSVYADLGAASRDFSKIYAVFFNRSIAESLGYDLDAAVKNGEWTFELFSKIAREAYEANDGNGRIKGYGSANMGDELTDIFLRSANIDLVENSRGTVPHIEFDSVELEAVIRYASSLIYGNPAAYSGDSSEFFSLFGSHGLLFALAPLSSMAEFSVCDVNWGVLPIPKYYEAQNEYYAYTTADAAVLAVPSQSNKTDMTGVLIGGFNCASYELLSEEYKTNCLYNYFRDIKALRSMDYVTGSITFDFNYLYASGTESLASATFGAAREARKSANRYATDLINRRSEKANAELSELFGDKTFEYPDDIPETEFVTDSATESDTYELTETEMTETEVTETTLETESEATAAVFEEETENVKETESSDTEENEETEKIFEETETEIADSPEGDNETLT